MCFSPDTRTLSTGAHGYGPRGGTGRGGVERVPYVASCLPCESTAIVSKRRIVVWRLRIYPRE